MGGQLWDEVGNVPLGLFFEVGGKIFRRPLGDGGLTSQDQLKATVRGQDLDPFIAPIGHIDEAFGVDGHAGGPPELAFAVTGTAEGG